MEKIFVYDFECLTQDWSVTFKNVMTGEYTVIVNDADELDYFTRLNLDAIFVGFNNNGYDKFIWDAILMGIDPIEVSKRIIEGHEYGWKFYRKFKYRTIQYDILKNLNARQSLKLSEGNLGLEIKETDVDFTIQTKLTDEQMEQNLVYNKKDVDATEELFIQTQGTFISKLALLKMYKLPLEFIQKTDAQLTAIILKAHKKPLWKNEIEIIDKKTFQKKKILDKDFYEPPENLKLTKYKYILEDFGNEVPDNFQSKQTKIAGIWHTIGLGGLHGDTKSKYYEGYLINLDVASYYPHLMILYNYMSRNVENPELFKEIMDLRLYHKKEFGLHHRVENGQMNDALKLVINTTYGALGAEFNELFDPRMRKSVCITGQLFLIDLIEKVEPYIEEFIQSNTDGIMFKINPKNLDKIKEIVLEWETRTGFEMEYTYGKRMWQKDVNNYIFETTDGKLKYKGAYVKDKTLDANSGIIINEAVKQYFVNNIMPEEYICGQDHPLEKFQYIVKGGTMFNSFYHKVGNDFIKVQKVNRAFATTLDGYGTIYKQKDDKETYERIGGLPEKCIIINDDIRDNFSSDICDILNYNFYIQATYKRIGDFLENGEV